MEKKTEVVILKRNTENKLKMSPDIVKEFYSGLRNELVSYPNVKERMLVACDCYKVGKEVVAKIALAGKVMKLYLPLDVNSYEVSKFHQHDVSDTKSYASTPFMVKVNSKLGLKKAKMLINDTMEKFGLQKLDEYCDVDFTLLFPYVENGEFEKATRKKKNDDVILEEEIVEEVKLATPKKPEVEVVAKEKTSKKTKVEPVIKEKPVVLKTVKKSVFRPKSKKLCKATINLSEVDANYTSGLVSLETLKEKGLLASNVVSFKVLGDGKLTKALEFAANGYSKSALEKIEAAGGKVK